MALWFSDFSRIRFSEDTGETLPRRQRLRMEGFSGVDTGDEIVLTPDQSQFAVAIPTNLTAGLSGRSGVVDGELVITAGFASSTDRSGAQFRFHAGASGGQVNPTDYSRIDCPNGQWRMLYEQNRLNAASFGAGLGLGLDGDRLRAACLTLSATGGIVQLGPGTFTLNNNTFVSILLGDNVTLRGSGRDVTKLVLSGTWSPAIHCQGNDRCTVEDLSIECQAYVNYITAIDAQSTTNCTVRRCRIYMTDEAAEESILGTSTLHAVLAQNSDDLTVEDCEIRNMQLKVGGAGGGDGCWVRRNRIEKPLNYAVSYVAANSVEFPSPVLKNCFIEDNVVTDPWSGGSFYVGPDGEQFSVAEMDTIHILRNVVNGVATVAGATFSVQVRLAAFTRDIRVCGNTIINDFAGPFTGSFAIRVQSVEDTDDVDGLDVSDNYVDGCDHAGVWINVHGKNIKACRNVLKRCRGLYLIADQGDLHDAIVADNVCDTTTIYGVRIRAETGNIYGLTVSGNNAVDVSGSGAGATGNAAYHFDAESGYRIEATCRGNTARNKSRTDMGYGAWMYGQGTVDVHFEANHFHSLHTGFLRRAIGAGAGELAAGFATGRDNRGVGNVPCTREVTTRIADVSTAANSDVKSPCAGKVIGIRGALGAAITVANAAVTTAIEPAAGGGFVAITDGGFTVAFSGSARGDRDQALPSAANTVERAGTLRATTDGASSTAATEDVTFIIQEDA